MSQNLIEKKGARPFFTRYTITMLAVIFAMFFLFSQIPRAGASWNGSAGQVAKTAIWRSTTDALQTLSVLMVLSGASIVNQKMNEARLSNRPVRPGDIPKLAGSAAYGILNEPTVWSGVLGHFTSEVFAGEPASQILDLLAKNRQAHKLLFRSLQNGIVSFVTSAGWESGRELWQEARMMLKDAKDYEDAGEVFTLLSDLFSSQAHAADDKKDSHSALARKMLHNMAVILFYNPKLRRRYVHNIWKKRIANGVYLTQLIGLTGVTWVGMRAFPGRPAIVPFALGFAGGILGVYLPVDIQNRITDAFSWLRRYYISLGFDSCDSAFRTHNPPEKALGICENLRNDLMDITIETLLRNYDQLVGFLNKKNLAIRSGRIDRITKLQQKIAETRSEIRKSLQYAAEIYGWQKNMLARSRYNFGDSPVRLCEQAKVELASVEMQKLFAVFDPPLTDDPSYSEVIAAVLQKIYVEEFDESAYVRSANAPQIAECAPFE